MSWAQFTPFMLACFSLVPAAYIISLRREVRFWRGRALARKGRDVWNELRERSRVEVHLSADVGSFRDSVESVTDKLDRLREQTARELHRRELEGED